MAAKVQQRKGAWWVVVHANGRRWMRSFGKDKREAQRTAKELNAQLARGRCGLVAEKAPRTVAQALDEWFELYRKHFSEAFRRTTTDNIEGHLKPHLGAVPLTELTENHILRFIDQKAGGEKPLKASTLTNILSPLRRVCNLAVDAGEIPRNPLRNMGRHLGKVRRQQASEVETVSAWGREEVQILLRTAQEREPRFYPLLLFLLSTGARKGEALGLWWEDVNFAGGRVAIRRALVKGHQGTPKSGKGRSVPLSHDLAAVLRELLQQRHREGLERGWPEVPRWVFCSETGGPLDDRNVVRSWHRVRRAAQKQGVRPLRLHDTRHTFASHAIEHGGKSIPWLARQLGHADPALTLRVYAHVLREEEPDLSFLNFAGARRHPDGAPAIPADRPRPRRSVTRRGRGGKMVTRARFERATPSFGGWCSIQLSYRAPWWDVLDSNQ